MVSSWWCLRHLHGSLEVPGKLRIMLCMTLMQQDLGNDGRPDAQVRVYIRIYIYHIYIYVYIHQI